jgi:transcription initiation factor TFIIE subunit beta
LTRPQHEYTFRTKAALLTEIQRQTRKGGGIPVRALKESWKEAPAAIEELEKEGEVLVTRTQKDGTLRMVFWNEVRGDEKVEEEFLKLWHGLKTPNDVDLLKSLANGEWRFFRAFLVLYQLMPGRNRWAAVDTIIDTCP